MCHFITLVAPTDDEAALDAVLADHDRHPTAIANPSIQKLLRPDERQYLTYRGNCDCGTVLGYPEADRRRDEEEALAREEARLRRKRWSEAKVRRAMEDKLRSREHADDRAIDSYDMWKDVIHTLLERLRLPRVGLLVHSYRGYLDDETVEAVRREMPGDADVLGALAR